MDATEQTFEFIGGNLALDFANTVGGLPPDSISQDRLTNYSRLVLWGQQTDLISEYEAQLLLDKAADTPAAAEAVLEQAQTVRETIRRIFMVVAQGVQPDESDMDLFNSALAQATAGAQLIVTADGFEWEWHKDGEALDQMLHPVVRSAATLLTSGERQFVRKCAHELCPWLFVDTTKNHRRQWCRTAGCGNMLRVRKHRERQRSKAES